MSSIIALLHTSIVVGALYTLTCPNLAALATLSGTDIINHRGGDDFDGGGSQKNRMRRRESFLLGIRWGVGSSIAITLIAGILIGTHSGDPNEEWMWMNDWLRVMIQAFVGVFSLIIGTYGLVKALRSREQNLGTTAADLDFKKSGSEEVDSIGSAGQRSEITEIVVNRMLGDIEELSLDSADSGRQPQAVSIRLHQSNADESILEEQMATCLKDDDQDKRSENKFEETLGLSEFDLRMWKAAKSLTDNIMLYQDDDYSASDTRGHVQRHHHRSSLLTVDVDDNSAKDSMKRFYNTTTVPVLTKDPSISSKGSRSVASISRQSCSSQQRILTKMSRRCGTCKTCTPEVLAFFAGLVHGLSGPGEVLGVIPAVQLNTTKAILYLCTFCLTSSLVMGGFASFYGSFCKKLVERAGKKDGKESLNRAFLIELGSASLSVVIGIVWLTLLAVGELDVIAPIAPIPPIV